MLYIVQYNGFKKVENSWNDPQRRSRSLATRSLMQKWTY